jgi:hypothetical protein
MNKTAEKFKNHNRTLMQNLIPNDFAMPNGLFIVDPNNKDFHQPIAQWKQRQKEQEKK